MNTNRTRAIKAASSIVFICLLFVLVRWTGMLNFYRLPSRSMEPNYAQGKIIFSSSLPAPVRNDVVVYRDSNLAIPGYRPSTSQIFMGRLVALRGTDFAPHGFVARIIYTEKAFLLHYCRKRRFWVILFNNSTHHDRDSSSRKDVHRGGIPPDRGPHG